MNRILAVALMLMATGLTSRIAHAQQKIAYIDMQRALEETEEGKRVLTRLKTDFDKKQKELDSRQEELKKFKADLDKQATVLTADKVQQKQKELDGKVVQLQDSYVRMQKELQEKQATEGQRMYKKMLAVVAQIAQAENVTFVFDRSAGLLYAPPSLDLTNELIRKYNASAGSSSGGN
jgi:outer membrane protein